MKDKTYSERLGELNLPTLSYRPIRGDMIEVFKLINGKYDKNAAKFIKLEKDMAPRSGPRRNSNKIFTQRANYDIRKYSFTPRTAAMWNSIPEEIANAPSTNSLKNRLNKLWKDEDILYDFRAKISKKYQKAPQEEEFGIED